MRFNIPDNTFQPTIIPKKNKILVKIRPYTPADEEKVHKINEISLEISFRYFFNLFHRREPELFLIAEYENETIGFILVKKEEDLSEDPSSIIYAIAVAPEYRNLSVGTQLINAIIKILNQKEIKKLFLHVRVGNIKGINFYKRLGFTKVKKIYEFYSWGEDALRMVKKIE